MEHRIKFQTREWKDAIERINKKMEQGYFLDNIETKIQTIYGDIETTVVIQCFTITMFKYEKENEND